MIPTLTLPVEIFPGPCGSSIRVSERVVGPKFWTEVVRDRNPKTRSEGLERHGVKE